ncbi:MAG: response regulator transcription factor [Bryobacteraceae bacterium]
MRDETRIVIADDHPIVRKGLRQVIEEQPDLKVIAEAGDGEAGLALILKLQPHVAVLDLDMPKLDGFAVAAEIRKRNVAVGVIFLTIHSEVDLLRRAMDLGGKGYILKESALVDIVNGVRTVAAGRPFVSPSMTPALLEIRTRAQAFERSRPALGDLTASERRILSMIAAGKSTKEIAAELHIHHRTVETHRGSICHKLELNGPNALLRFALEHKSELLG